MQARTILKTLTHAQVPYAPNSKEDVRVLLAYIRKHGELIAERKTSEFWAEVKVVRNMLADYFSKTPPCNKVEHWKVTGAYAQCQAIARKHMVPTWDIVSYANPYSSPIPE